MNRRNFLKFSGAILANTIYFPLIGNKKVTEWFIENIEDFEAISQNALDPGDIVYFREGTYYIQSPVCNVYWEGSSENPIIVKPYQNEKVIIDGSIDIFGDYQHWDGFEILNTRWLTRDSEETGSNPTDIGDAYEAFIIDAEGATITNCDLHDCRQGVRSINDNNLRVENCRIWNNGWSAPDRGHGHGIYWNGDGCTIKNNWFGKGYSEWGVHVYGAISDNLICEGNELEDAMILVSTCKNAVITKNEIKMITEDDTRFTTYNPTADDEIYWDHNNYLDYREDDYNFTYGMNFNQWQEKFGFDLHSQYWITKEKRKKKVLKKLYPGFYELNQELGDSVVRLPPAVHAVWLKDIEES